MQSEKASSLEAQASAEHVEELPEALEKDFSVWSLASLCLCLMATWEALGSVVAAALTSGGAPCLFYNYIISFICTIMVACSLGEIASIYPTAAGQYHWVAMLAPEREGIVPSWFTGWISIGGQIVLTASAGFLGGLQLQSLITLNNPHSYVPERWQGMLFYWLVLAYSAAVNIWGSKILPHTNLASGVFHIAGLLAVLIIFGVMAPKHSAHYVFVETQNSSGWTNDGVSWLVGLISTVYPFLGYDAACHLSEELPDPKRNVPLAIVGSVLVNGILGFGYAVMLLFSLGDLNDLLTSPTGFPFVQLFISVTRSPAGATVLTLCPTLIAVAANAAGLTSTSRTAWAFARDSAVPFSSYFSHVDHKVRVPVRMIICVSIIQMLIGFLYLGSTTAINAVLSMAILGMYASYLLPIIYMLLYGRNSARQHPRARFSLGKIGGGVINLISICWLIFAMVFSTFPGYQPVTSKNMNYAVAVMGAWLLFGAVFYFAFGRKGYSGPVLQIPLDEPM